MKKKINLPLIERKSNNLSKIIVILFICNLLILFLNIFLWNAIILYYFTIGLIIGLGLFMGAFNSFKQVGTLTMTDDAISINNNEIIPIQNVQNLKIVINGFEGRRGIDNLRSIFADDGKNNFIEFVYNDSNKKLRFFVSTQNYNELNKVIGSWEKATQFKLIEFLN